MGRPHFHRGIAELRRLFESNENNVPILQELLQELAHRKTRDARAASARHHRVRFQRLFVLLARLKQNFMLCLSDALRTRRLNNLLILSHGPFYPSETRRFSSAD
jgi:hypothetical protein